MSVRLSLYWSICPSLSVCLCVGVSVHLFHHPSVWLSVVSGGVHSLPRHPPPGQQRSLLAQGVGKGCRAAASGSFSSSWAELGVRASQLQKWPLPWALRPRTPEQKEERKEGLTAAEPVLCVYRRRRGRGGPHFTLTLPFLPKARPCRIGIPSVHLPYSLANRTVAEGCQTLGKEGLGALATSQLWRVGGSSHTPFLGSPWGSL